MNVPVVEVVTVVPWVALPQRRVTASAASKPKPLTVTFEPGAPVAGTTERDGIRYISAVAVVRPHPPPEQAPAGKHHRARGDPRHSHGDVVEPEALGDVVNLCAVERSRVAV